MLSKAHRRFSPFVFVVPALICFSIIKVIAIMIVLNIWWNLVSSHKGFLAQSCFKSGIFYF